MKFLHGKILRVLLLVLFVPLLSTCSSYKVVYDYKPPITPEGLSCVGRAQSQLTQCNTQCSHQFHNCARKAELQARKILPQLLKEYPQKLELWLNERESYRRDLSYYELRVTMLESRQDRFLDRCEKDGMKRSKCRRHHSFPSIYLDRPSFTKSRPIKPTLASETNRIRKLTCNANCGCENNFRMSYASCGGVVTSKKVCTKNCN